MDGAEVFPKGRGGHECAVAELVRYGGEHVWEAVGTLHATVAEGEEHGGERGGGGRGRGDGGCVLGVGGAGLWVWGRGVHV